MNLPRNNFKVPGAIAMHIRLIKCARQPNTGKRHLPAQLNDGASSGGGIVSVYCVPVHKSNDDDNISWPFSLYLPSCATFAAQLHSRSPSEYCNCLPFRGDKRIHLINSGCCDEKVSSDGCRWWRTGKTYSDPFDIRLDGAAEHLMRGSGEPERHNE